MGGCQGHLVLKFVPSPVWGFFYQAAHIRHAMNPQRILQTGIDGLDEFLGGSLPRNVILDVYGPGGSGKSQLLMQAAVEAAAAGFRVAFVDTTGDFRPERMLQMHPQHSVLDHIGVLRATCVAEQMAAPAMTGDVDLLLVDNVTDLFMYEYSGEEAAPMRTHMLGAHMRSMAASCHGIRCLDNRIQRHTLYGQRRGREHAACNGFVHPCQDMAVRQTPAHGRV